MKSIFHPDQITIHDVEYAIFNKKMKVVSEDDDFSTQQDFISAPDFRDTSNDRVKYKFVVPSEDPCGNLPTDIVWVGAGGHEYTVDDLLALVQEMRLGRAQDMYGNTNTQPVQAATGTDLGDDGEEAVEDNESEDGSSGTTPGGMGTVWT